jgi:hypothetical protein
MAIANDSTLPIKANMLPVSASFVARSRCQPKARLIDAGRDVVEAAAITGHASLKELQRYIEDRDRKKAARRAMGKLRSGTELSNPTIRFDSEAKKA